ncbi:MAG: histidine phosphatase family protein [Deltaproteobacteria bacterium]|nr:histidine phosphatase family protein [Deltaproteobacteria bacterium]
MSDLFVIRHGQASIQAADYDCLSPLGRRQAEVLGDHFRHLGVKFDRVYSGTLSRQRDTAEIVLSRLGGPGAAEAVTPIPGFNEYDAKAVMNTYASLLIEKDPSMFPSVSRMAVDRRSFQRIHEPATLGWVAGDPDIQGAETWEGFTSRVRAGVERIMKENGRGRMAALFTSGGVMSVIVQMALGLSGEETMRLSWQVRNASVSLFKYNDKRLSLAGFNSVAHLETLREVSLLTYR